MKTSIFVHMKAMDSYNITFQTWNAVAQAYQDKFMGLDLYNDSYDQFCRLVKKSPARILEIGCGPGNIARYLLSQRPDFILEGIDVAPNMVALAQANNPQARFTVMDVRHLDTLCWPVGTPARATATKFDGIVCGFCIPYLSKTDCAKLIKDVAHLLHPGGLFYCSAMEGDYEQSGYEKSSTGHQSYVYYHQAAYLTEQLQVNGFGGIQLIRQQHPGREATEMIFMAEKE
jgi:predicted TPR repeat methyltransferase